MKTLLKLLLYISCTLKILILIYVFFYIFPNEHYIEGNQILATGSVVLSLFKELLFLLLLQGVCLMNCFLSSFEVLYVDFYLFRLN